MTGFDYFKVIKANYIFKGCHYLKNTLFFRRLSNNHIFVAHLCGSPRLHLLTRRLQQFPGDHDGHHCFRSRHRPTTRVPLWSRKFVFVIRFTCNVSLCRGSLRLGGLHFAGDGISSYKMFESKQRLQRVKIICCCLKNIYFYLFTIVKTLYLYNFVRIILQSILAIRVSAIVKKTRHNGMLMLTKM